MEGKISDVAKIKSRESASLISTVTNYNIAN
jgi:hypothetical protein